jgi:hypothetical protein
MIREATPEDEPELLRMMRHLAKQEPGKIQFDEAAARASLRKFRSLPVFGGGWMLCEGNKTVDYVILTVGFSFEFHGHDAFIDELYVDAEYRWRGKAGKRLSLSKRRRRRGA